MIIRAKKQKNYTIVSNHIFKNNDISARAKGVYAYIMTLPDDWKLYKSELFNRFSEGKKAIDTAFKELEENQYISKKRVKNKFGKFEGWEYTVFEHPATETPISDQSEKGKSENRQVGNGQLLSTNEPNTNKQSTNNIYIDYFNHWNKMEIIKHRSLPKKAESKIKKLLNDYSKEEIIKAITNYSEILKNSDYYWTYKWTLSDFLYKGIERFFDESDPFSNFRSGSKKQNETFNERMQSFDYSHNELGD